MKMVVIADDTLKKEMLEQGLCDNIQVEWMNELMNVPGANCFIDLLFTYNPARIEALQQLHPATVIVNSIIHAADTLPESFIRINGWPTFLRRSVIEASSNDSTLKQTAEKIFTCFNKTTEWVPNIPGFISARVISMIINEAYFTLDEKISSKEEIDTAMKLGTNYPFGPFEWSKKIGLKNVYDLLTALAQTSSRYTPSLLLQTEASA